MGGRRKVFGAGLLAALLAGCMSYTPHAVSQVTQPDPQFTAGGETLPPAAKLPVTILVSIDGFRPDYLNRGVTPNLSRLAAGGVSSSMRPSFPSITFPNHWTLVTGLRPDRTGIVANTMEDPSRPGQTFTMQTDDPFWWKAAEPIWVFAEQQGIRTATMFWPGSNVAWGGQMTAAHHYPVQGGTRPSDWQQYNQYVTGEQRVAAVLDWMRRPGSDRPRFVTLYFDIVDSAGHDVGPDGQATTDAAAKVDSEIGLLTQGLAQLQQPANLVIVSDHGMAATSSQRVVALDRIANPADYRAVQTGAFAGIAPVPGHEAALEAALLRPHDHLQCWRKADIPARLHYGTNPRVEPYVCLADVGWEVLKTTPTHAETGGEHGYDNGAPEMRALFIANGPGIAAQGRTLPTFDNVDVYPLLRDLLGLAPVSGVDGDDAPFRDVLQRP